MVSTAEEVKVKFNVLKGKSKVKIEEQLELHNFIDVKGWKSHGNKLSSHPINGKIKLLEITKEKVIEKPEEKDIEANAKEAKSPQKEKKVIQDIQAENTNEKQNNKFKPGDTLEFDF